MPAAEGPGPSGVVPAGATPVAVSAGATPVAVLAEAASAVHASGTLEAKLEWVLDATVRLTGAAVVAYAEVGSELVLARGCDPSLVTRHARPGLVHPAGRHRRRSAADLVGDRRFRRFLASAGLDPATACGTEPVPAADGDVHGVLVVCGPGPDELAPEVGAAVSVLATHLGVALDNHVTIDRLAAAEAEQRAVVHELQEAVRPAVPRVDRAELGIHYLPADPSAPTGGDLYDWMVLPDGELHLAVIDVMGKGVEATKDAVTVTQALRFLVLDGCPLDRLVARAHALVEAQSPELVATVVVARYAPETGVVRLAGGGQPPPLVLHGDHVRATSVPGVPIGWPGSGSSEIITVTLDRNDALVLYTDGLIESTKDVLVGIDNLVAAAGQVRAYPARHLARALVERSLAGAMRRDDSLALVLRRRVPPTEEHQGAIGPFEYRFSPSDATVPLGRHLLGDWLDLLDVDPEERSDLLLVATELSANAVRHASGAPAGVCLRAWVERDAVVVEVSDDGAGFERDDLRPADVPDPDVERGRGLFVVEALTDEVTVERRDDRTVVTARRLAVLAVD